jgi:hypothetical protein
LEWEKKSKLTGIGVTALVHMCHNAVPVCALALLFLFRGEALEHKATPCPPSPPSQTEKAPHQLEAPTPRAKDTISSRSSGPSQDKKETLESRPGAGSPFDSLEALLDSFPTRP